MIPPMHLLTRQALERARRNKVDNRVEVHVIKNSDIRACPHFIMVPEHYRPDGSCRCNEPQHTVMRDWGYTWDAKKGRWT